MLNLKEEIQNSAKECKECEHGNDCPKRTIILYIDDVGLDYFCYQLDNNKLPDSIRIAIVQLELLSKIEELTILTLLAQLLDD